MPTADTVTADVEELAPLEGAPATRVDARLRAVESDRQPRPAALLASICHTVPGRDVHCEAAGIV